MTVQLTMAQLRLLKHLARNGELSRLSLMNAGGFSATTIEAAKRANLVYYDIMTGRYSLTEKGKGYT